MEFRCEPRVGANVAANRQFYGILNAPGDPAAFELAARDTRLRRDRPPLLKGRRALFERNHRRRPIYEVRMERVLFDVIFCRAAGEPLFRVGELALLQINVGSVSLRAHASVREYLRRYLRVIDLLMSSTRQ